MKDTHRPKEMKNIFHANGNFLKTVVAIPTSDKIDFKTKE